MKPLRKTLLAAAVLLPLLAALLGWLPARWALPWLRPLPLGLQLEQVGGSVWQGHADRVLAADGRVLGRLQWRLSRRALWGTRQGWLDFSGAQGELRGDFARNDAGQWVWREVQARIALEALAAAGLRLPGQARGELLLQAPHAVLQGGWPLELQGELQWRQATLRTAQGELALGNLQAQLTAQGGVIHAQWRDDGHGPLRSDGKADFSPLGWRVSATLQAHQATPALQRWLATLGQADAQGVVHIQRRGGLLAAPIKEPTAP